VQLAQARHFRREGLGRVHDLPGVSRRWGRGVHSQSDQQRLDS
jgi:hypothetical protein